MMKKILKITAIILIVGALALLGYAFYDIFTNYKTIGEGFRNGWPFLMMSAGLILLSIVSYNISTTFKDENKDKK